MRLYLLILISVSYFGTTGYSYIPGTFWLGRVDVMRKMTSSEEKNAGIAIATASIFDEDGSYFSPQKSARIKRFGYHQTTQDTTEQKESHWKFNNIGNLYLAQIAYSDYWKGSGYNNINLWGDFDWKAIYKKGRNNFTYNFNVQYGLMKRNGQEWIKNRDKLEMSGNYGHQFSNRMFLSGLMSMRTFLSNSYKLNKEGMKENLNGRFFSPVTFDVGSGLNLKTLEPTDKDEKKEKSKNKLDIYYTPINSKVTIATDSVLASQYLPEKFQAQGYRIELGSLVKVVMNFQLMENVFFESKADFFTNHLDHFGNFDVNIESKLLMKVNKTISVNILGNLVYDEDILFDIVDDAGEPTGNKGPRTQFSESINVGLTHSF